jgi:PAS domain S-box-containing protein
MALKQLVHSVRQLYNKTPLEFSLGLPFILLTLATVGAVFCFSYKNVQNATEDLSEQLRRDITKRIEEKIKTYTEIPDTINQLNSRNFAAHIIDIEKAKGEEQFWQQSTMFPSTSAIYCASESSGAIFGTLKSKEDQSVQFWMSNINTRYIASFYSLNFVGKRDSFLRKEKGPFFPRKRDWYIEAKKAGRATWSKIYSDHNTGLPTITYSRPVYSLANSSLLLGVCGTDFYLPQEMTKFLDTLEVGKNGTGFILQQEGKLVAPLEKQITSKKTNDEDPLSIATISKNKTISETAKFLIPKIKNFEHIKSTQFLELEIDGKKQFVQVSKFQRYESLNWLIVTVLPENEIMGRIKFNTYITLLSCITALIIGVGISILTARWITRPLVRLSQSAKALARGEWDQTVAIERTGDLGELAASFNWMAQQLQATFTEERRQAEEALQRSEAKFRRLFEADLIGAIVADLDGTVIEANEAFLNIVNYTQDDVKASIVNWIKMTPSEYEQDDRQAIAELRNMGVCSSYEKEFCDKDGGRVPVLIGYALLPENQQRVIGFVLDLTQQKEAALAEKIQAEEASRLETSNRFAAWAHDTFAQDFAAIKFQADGVEPLLADNPKAQATIRIICELATEGLRVARDVVETLPPESSQPLTEDLSSTLELWIDQRFTGTSLQVQKNIQPSPDSLPEDISLNLLLVAREVITNTIKHANASTVAVELTFDSQAVRLRVQDNGNGFDPDLYRHKGSGLENMQKRVQALGGQQFISSSVGQGTEIVVTVTLAAPLLFSTTINKRSPKGSI